MSGVCVAASLRAHHHHHLFLPKSAAKKSNLTPQSKRNLPATTAVDGRQCSPVDSSLLRRNPPDFHHPILRRDCLPAVVVVVRPPLHQAFFPPRHRAFFLPRDGVDAAGLSLIIIVVPSRRAAPNNNGISRLLQFIPIPVKNRFFASTLYCISRACSRCLLKCPNAMPFGSLSSACPSCLLKCPDDISARGFSI